MRVFDGGNSEPRRPAAHRPAVLSVGDESLAETMGPAIAWPDDLLRVTGIHLNNSKESRLVCPGPDSSGAAESFRLLGHRLRGIHQTRGANRVLITSSIPGEGKTVIAANLAVTLGRGPERVLLIEADMRKPGVPGALADGPLPGLGDWLEGRLTLPEVLRRIEGQNIWMIPSGMSERNPGELIQEAALRKLLDTASRKFDWVVVDSPPLNPFIDAHLLLTMTDTAVLVLRSGVTDREVYENSLKQLKNAPLAGVVLNAYEDAARSSYYSYYPANR